MATTKIIGKVSIIPCGTYVDGTTYTRLSVVNYQGGSYIALVDNTNIVPTNDSVWYLLTAPGRGIQQIEKIGTVGLVDTYRITYTDGTHFDYTVNNGASKTSELTNDVGFITNQVDDLANYLLAVDTGAYIELSYDSEGYTVTANLKNSSDTIISTGTAQLPLGGNYVSSSYNDGVITLTKLNGTSDTIELNDLVKKSTTIAGLYLADNITTQELIEALDVYTIPEINDNFVSNSASGESIYIDNSSNLTLKDFQIKGNATQDTSILTYKCVGTETGDYYFVYDSTNYQFTMPTISANDLLTFNTSTKKLYQGTTQITTTTASTGTLITLSATPNPDYPQDIHVVTGDNTVVEQGKNILNRTTCVENTALRWVYGDTYVEQKSLSTDFIPITRNLNIACNYVAQKLFYDSNKNYLGVLKRNGTLEKDSTDANLYNNFTIPDISNICYMRLGFRAGSNGGIDMSTVNIQVEIGESNTSFVPYQTPQIQLLSLGSLELAKIGTYIDKIYKSSGKWYLEKNIEKIESYNEETINTDYISSTGGLDIGATVYYQLTTPTIIEIIDTTLIGQLENVLKMRTYNNITNIFVQTNNAQPYLYIDYYINNVEMIKDIQEENTKLYKSLLDQIPQVTIDGQSINVKDSSNLPIQDFQMQGNASQNTNIMTYVCSGNESGYYYFVYNNVNYQFIMPTITQGELLTFNTTTLKLYQGTTEIATTIDNTGTLITLSSTPNPDYSQDIHVVTGDNTVKVLGKNWFDLNAIPDYKQSIISYTTTSTGIKIKSTLTYGGVTFGVGDFEKIKGKTFTIKMTSSDIDKISSSSFLLYDKDNYASTVETLGNALGNDGEVTVTIPSTSTKNRVGFRFYLASATANQEYTINNIQLEENTTATTYQPFTEQTQLISLGNIELAKIGNYTDKIYKSGGKWWLEKNIDKAYLGIKSYVKSGTSQAIFRTSFDYYGDYTSVNVICPYFLGITDQQGNVINSIRINSGGNCYIVLPIDSEIATSTDTFKSFLTTNNVYAFFIKRVPTTTEITNTTLISQLENVLKMTTYKNITNIFDVVISPNETPYLQVTYKQDLDTLLDNLDARISLLE